jgi:DNA-binding beta-propeller fold protein YncE
LTQDGDVFVSDTRNSRIEKFKPNGDLDSAFGQNGVVGINEDREVDGKTDPGNKNGEFKYPIGIYVKGGFLYVADTVNNRWQILSSKDGKFIKSGKGNAIVLPNDILVDSKGYIYLLCGDFYRKQCWIVKVNPENNEQIISYGKNGLLGGSFGKETGFFNKAMAFAIDDDDNLYVSDSKNARVQIFDSNGQLLNVFYPENKLASVGAIAFDPKNKEILLAEYYEYKGHGHIKRYKLEKFIYPKR